MGLSPTVGASTSTTECTTPPRSSGANNDKKARAFTFEQPLPHEVTEASPPSIQRRAAVGPDPVTQPPKPVLRVIKRFEGHTYENNDTDRCVLGCAGGMLCCCCLNVVQLWAIFGSTISEKSP